MKIGSHQRGGWDSDTRCRPSKDAGEPSHPPTSADLVFIVEFFALGGVSWYRVGERITRAHNSDCESPQFQTSPTSNALIVHNIDLQSNVDYKESPVSVRNTFRRTFGTHIPLHFHSRYPPLVIGEELVVDFDPTHLLSIGTFEGQPCLPKTYTGVPFDPIRNQPLRGRIAS